MRKIKKRFGIDWIILNDETRKELRKR